MEQQGIILTETDRLILQSYRGLVRGLEDYLGEGYEIVLHSLESIEHSVIALAKGHHTGRNEGSPITDLALYMLNSIQEQERDNGYISYFSRNRNGEPLRSSTIVIYGENNRAIGVLCINFYMNTPLYKIVNEFISDPKETKSVLPETFANNVEDLLQRIVEQVRTEVEENPQIHLSLKNKEIIRRCNAQGVFKIKSAVTSVAKMLNISKNTVYMHLKSLDT